MLPKALADGDGNASAPECQAAHRALPIGAPSRNHLKKLLHIRD